MQDYMILVGCVVEVENEDTLRVDMPDVVDAVRRGLIAHGYSEDQHISVYVLKLTPEQAQGVIDAPTEGLELAKSAISIAIDKSKN